jgi:hypothetical protein
MKNLIPILLILFSCSNGKENGKVAEKSGKDPDANWLTLYNADSARTDYKKGNRRILQYGLRMVILPEKIHDSLCNAYHFVNYDAGDCEATKKFTNGVEEYNTEMRKLLEQLNGKGWHERYIKVIDSFIDIERSKKDDGLVEPEKE